MKEKLLRRFISVVSTFSLLVNSYIAPLSVLAQEVSPTPEATPAIEETITPISESTPTTEETIAPTTEPTIEPTQTPEETILPTEIPTDEVVEEVQDDPVQSDESTDSSPVSASTSTPEVKAVTTENTELEVSLLENTSSTSVNEFDFSIQQDGSATLITDKADYAPTDTALITGSGFIPNKEYSIEITSTTGNFLFSDKVTSDESGGLFYAYQLDGTYRPDYKVEIIDENGVISSITFTDSPASGCTNDSGDVNDETGQKDLTKMCVDYSGLDTNIDVSWNWDDISWSGSNTGDACSLFDTDSDGKVNYALCVGVNGNPAVKRYTKLYSCADTDSNNCKSSVLISEAPGSTCATSLQNTDPFSAGDGFPVDTEAKCNILMSEVGGAASTLLDVCSYPSGSPSSSASDCILYKAKSGKLTITKELLPNGDQGLFNLLVDSAVLATNVTNGGSTLTQGLNEGNHTFGEAAGTGTNLSDYSKIVSCRDDHGTGAIVSTTGINPWTVNIINGADILCTITNTRNQGTLRVIKTVINDNGGTKTANDFSFQVNGGNSTLFEADGQNDLTVAPGTYSVIEPSVSGYATTYSNCTGVSVVSGQTTTCTITNDDIQPKLTVTKVVNGGNLQVSDFPLFVGATGVISGVQNGFNVNTYTVSETNKPGYTSIISGNCASNGSITLGLGDIKSCTITNTRDIGTITIDKVTIPAGDTTDFNFNILSTDTSINQNIVLKDQDTPFSETFDTGIYTIEEKSLPSTWSLSNLVCDQSATVDLNNKKVTFDLDNGENIKCTFTNTKLPTLAVNKILSPVGHGGFDLKIDGISYASNVGNGGTTGSQIVNVGTHNVSETNGNPSTVMGDYSVTFGGDCDSTGSITLAAGQNGVCTITNVAYGSLTIIKDAIPNNAQDFSFTTTGVGLSSFQLDDDSDSTLSNSRSFSYLTPGTYSVTETGVTGWDLTSATCGDGSTLNSINVSAGENITCTFTNTKFGNIIVEKQTLPNGSLKSFNFVSSYNVNGFSLVDDGQNNSGYLLPGTYSVNENTPSGWNMNYSCSNGSNKDSINLEAGETITCIFTNTQRGSIYGYKYEDTDGSNSTTLDRTVVAGWTIELWKDLVKVGEAITGVDGKFTFSDLVFGDYKLIEKTISGWFNVTSDNINVNLVPGEEDGPNNFVNFEKATIIVHKNVFGPFGTDVSDSTQFSVFLDGSNKKSLAEGIGTEATYSDLTPGRYTISEDTVPAGYKFESITNNGIVDVTSGGEFHIYIINSQLPAKLTVIKHVINDDGGNLDASDFTMTVDGTDVQDEDFFGSEAGTIVDLGAGTYSVDENFVGGYSKSLSAGCTGTISFGESKTCTVTNDDQSATLIVKKVVINRNGGTKDVNDFSFSVNNGVETPFETDGQNDLNVNAGTYSIVEPKVDGYSTSYNNCTGVVVSNGGTATCTITNDDDQPQFQLIKEVINDNGGTSLVSDFRLYIDITQVTSGAINSFDAGNYLITETGPDGYASSFSGDCDLQGNFTLVVGDPIRTCTLTNDDIAPTLRLRKEVATDNGGNEDGGDWVLYADGSIMSFYGWGPVVGPNQVRAGVEYTLTESDNNPGYLASSWVCIGGGIKVGNKITLSPDEDVTCTIRNNDIAPKLTIVKDPTNNSGGNALPNDFQLTVGGNGVLSGVKNGYSANTPYVINETQLSGYTFVSITGNSKCPLVLGGTITLNEGDDITCTITNDDTAPKLTIVKDPTNNSGGNALPNDFQLTVGGNGVLSGVKNGYSANTPYVINETELTGYTFVSITGNSKCPSTLGGTITLDEGDDITCTITNDDVAPTITLIKDVINNNGGVAQPDDFNLTIASNPVLSGSTTSVDANTLIALDETVFGGYDFVNITGDSKCPSVLGGSVTLNEGENITCTIHNDDQIPYLTVIKNVVGGNKTSGDFTIYVTADNVSDPTFAGSSTGITVSLDAGNYIVSEDPVVGYTPSFSDDCDGSISLGESKTCTITNTRDTGFISGSKFRDIDGNGTINTEDLGNPVSGISISLSEYDLSNKTISNTIYDTTDSLGAYNFDNVPTGAYLLCETVPNGSYQTYPNAGTIGATTTDQDVCYIITLKTEGENINHMDFANSPFESIYGYKFNDLNGNGTKDGDEENLSDWTIFLDMNSNGQLDSGEESRITDKDGNYSFNGLVVDTYRVCEVNESNWRQTTTPLCYTPDFTEIDNFEAIFGNQRIIPEIVIEKTNNKLNGARINDEIIYTLKVKNTGNIEINNLEVIDILPGGFEYISGTSSINDLSVPDPVIASGVLKWNIGNINSGEEIKITYKAKVLSSVFEGSSYKNFATCKGTYISGKRFTDNDEQVTSFVSQDGQESTLIECNIAYSSVLIGTGIGYGGNLLGQVLGASTELPATGSNTLWIILAISMLGIGIYLSKKYAKN